MDTVARARTSQWTTCKYKVCVPDVYTFESVRGENSWYCWRAEMPRLAQICCRLHWWNLGPAFSTERTKRQAPETRGPHSNQNTGQDALGLLEQWHNGMARSKKVNRTEQ